MTAKFADLDDGQRYLDWYRGQFEEEWNQEYPQVPQWLENLGPATVRANTVEIVRLLLEYGADAMARDDYGRLPLQTYLQLPNNSNNNKRIGTHNPETVRLLLAYSEGLEPDGDDAYALIDKAVFSEANEDIFELLFEYGIKPNLGFNGETTWLHLAASFSVENVSTYQGLIDGGIDPQLLDDEGKTACDRLLEDEESPIRSLKESFLGRELMLDDVAALLCELRLTLPMLRAILPGSGKMPSPGYVHRRHRHNCCPPCAGSVKPAAVFSGVKKGVTYFPAQ